MSDQEIEAIIRRRRAAEEREERRERLKTMLGFFGLAASGYVCCVLANAMIM